LDETVVPKNDRSRANVVVKHSDLSLSVGEQVMIHSRFHRCYAFTGGIYFTTYYQLAYGAGCMYVWKVGPNSEFPVLLAQYPRATSRSFELVETSRLGILVFADGKVSVLGDPRKDPFLVMGRRDTEPWATSVVRSLHPKDKAKDILFVLMSDHTLRRVDIDAALAGHESITFMRSESDEELDGDKDTNDSEACIACSPSGHVFVSKCYDQASSESLIIAFDPYASPWSCELIAGFIDHEAEYVACRIDGHTTTEAVFLVCVSLIVDEKYQRLVVFESGEYSSRENFSGAIRSIPLDHRFFVPL
jgi:hypothetical protein